ncbi:MAG: selenocysteine-specific translation elongation factor [Acidobacteria bacterium]|nr:MAG: selenocysteine-specific translation elongation factor [Acidobacteriota bacterium]REJ98102.1 MAG: selenocysteine-specific translation elongation factor [Acidobacteriota bacterium]REK16845.1 MAG: selenocysteine-specific translation elongation factor [Acidobacteriota bacterium]REK42756.1 MAG: selenocysteine-specific translation elongation factor [Acidobacteriota bacterium]
MDLVVGTAGHIDHGKTALVKALTGIDADRLPEEKKRGITIDLGFADLRTDSARISFVDVPGHERFVKNMLAGAGGIDLVMLVVAADSGVMPQTREHFEICRLLGTERGLIVVTKSDLAEEEFIELVEMDIAELVAGSFLENAPVFRASAKTTEGVEAIREWLSQAAADRSERESPFATRLPIDRSFSVKGFGTVVTGTLSAGKIRSGEEMDLLPSGVTARVRGIQTHGDDVDIAFGGRRTAVNLGGIDHDQIPRGTVLADPGSFKPTQMFDTQVEVLAATSRPLRSRQRVRVHIGTSEVLARVEVLNESREIAPGDSDLVQFRLETPVVAAPSDRFIVRQYSPQFTIAGGTVLVPLAEKHKKKDLASTRTRLEALLDGDLMPRALVLDLLLSAGINGKSAKQIQEATGIRPDLVGELLADLVAAGDATKTEKTWVSSDRFAEYGETIVAFLKEHHAADPLAEGMLRETLREQSGSYVPEDIFRFALKQMQAEGKLVSERDIVRLSSHSRELSAEESKVLDSLSRIYLGAGLEVPVLKDAIAEASAGTSVKPDQARKIFQMLVDSAEVLKVTDEMFFAKEAIAELITKLKKYAEEEAENRLITVPEFKDLAGISRKWAIPLLEYFDAIKVTRRAGDKRLVL